VSALEDGECLIMLQRASLYQEDGATRSRVYVYSVIGEVCLFASLCHSPFSARAQLVCRVRLSDFRLHPADRDTPGFPPARPPRASPEAPGAAAERAPSTHDIKMCHANKDSARMDPRMATGLRTCRNRTAQL
jgi:hypothetical protein